VAFAAGGVGEAFGTERAWVVVPTGFECGWKKVYPLSSGTSGNFSYSAATTGSYFWGGACSGVL